MEKIVDSAFEHTGQCSGGPEPSKQLMRRRSRWSHTVMECLDKHDQDSLGNRTKKERERQMNIRGVTKDVKV